MRSDETPQRIHVRFSGRVQGVGFRYTVCRIAEKYAVTGFVRNLPDGDVELVAEAPDDETLSDFLADIRNSPLKSHVLREQSVKEAATGEYRRFGVSF